MNILSFRFCQSATREVAPQVWGTTVRNALAGATASHMPTEEQVAEQEAEASGGAEQVAGDGGKGVQCSAQQHTRCSDLMSCAQTNAKCRQHGKITRSCCITRLNCKRRLWCKTKRSHQTRFRFLAHDLHVLHMLHGIDHHLREWKSFSLAKSLHTERQMRRE